jgi:hypothetical protein
VYLDFDRCVRSVRGVARDTLSVESDQPELTKAQLKQNLERLQKRIAENPRARSAFLRDPAAALGNAGLSVTASRLSLVGQLIFVRLIKYKIEIRCACRSNPRRIMLDKFHLFEMAFRFVIVGYRANLRTRVDR